MSDRPSDGMTLDELREEFDWMYEFQSRMAERIREDADVHNLADYVGKLERENAELRELVADMYKFMSIAEELNAHIKLAPSETCSFANRMRELGVEI